MDHPDNPQRGSEPEADLPKPPIWQQATAPTAPVTPPIHIPAAPRASRPGIGAGTFDRPQWPTEPPTARPLIEPTPPPARRRRVGLTVVAVLAALAVAASAFFIGRAVATSETAMTPIANPAPVAEVEPTTPPATAVPAPTPLPTPTAVVEVPVPVLPADNADEPVAAVAAAVGPAVVLIQNQLGQGSGIIYDQAGLILTNAHVVGQFTEVQVTLASGVKVPGEVLGADPLTDVAVVRMDTDAEFGVAALAPQSTVAVGQLAVAIGSPFGLEQTVTSGIVSAVGRVLLNATETGQDSIVAMIQTDAPINPGNSGGALADRQGRVIGMNTSIRTDGTGGNIGVGFAIPADTAKLIADRIIAGEPLEQGFLGISGTTPLIGDPGVVVGEVTPGSGAQLAGIEVGDLITGFNGKQIRSMVDLAAEVRLQAPNTVVGIQLERDGQVIEVEVTLGRFSDT